MAKKGKNIKTVKGLFAEKQMTLQDLIEEVKFFPPEKGSASQIKNAKDKLKSLMQKVRDKEKWIEETEEKIKFEPNYYLRLKMQLDIEQEKDFVKKIDPSAQRNYIRMLEGKDFYYHFNTGFKTHQIKRSDLLKQDDNKIFLDLYRSDIESAIENLKKSKDPFKAKKIKILRERLLPVVAFNEEMNSIRNINIDELSPRKRNQIEKAANPDIAKGEKGNKYPINIIISNDLIKIG